MVSVDFTTDPPANCDPEVTARSMLMMFGGEAFELAFKRAEHFLQIDDMERARYWLIVRAHLKEIEIRTSGAGRQ